MGLSVRDSVRPALRRTVVTVVAAPVAVLGAWVGVSGVHALASAATFPVVGLRALATTFVVVGWLPLLAVLAVVPPVTRLAPRMGPRALTVLVSLAFGSGLGVIAVAGWDDPRVHVWIGTWLLLGLLAPLPDAGAQAGVGPPT